MSLYSRWRERLSRRKKNRRQAVLRWQKAHELWERAKRKGWPKRRRRAHADMEKAKREGGRLKRRVAQAKQRVRRYSDSRWGGSRAITNEVIDIVAGRARVSSRKRWELFGNPGSDHHRSQKVADAVDFAIAEAHWLKNEISRRLGGPSELADYDSFIIVRNGASYRVQIIAGTHGTGPHLHVGVRRVG